MKIPYSNPNLKITDLIRATFISHMIPEYKIKKYFANLTGKKHILLTNSCRTALFLAYTALREKGEVITSPLTCKVAIDPIVESGHTPVFADVSLANLNIQPEDIERRITPKTVAIQAIHFGGVPCDMARIQSIAKSSHLILIEDCAQSLGAVTAEAEAAGSFGDVSCFSLIKNAYGIGGGVLATNDDEIFRRGQAIIDGWNDTPFILILFRIIRNILETKRKYRLFFLLHKFFMSLKSRNRGYKSVIDQLHRMSIIEKKISAYQIDRLTELHIKRKSIGKRYYELLIANNLMLNNSFSPDDASFTKLFVFHPAINSKICVQQLNNNGIEAMHLEHKYGSPYQEKLAPLGSSNENILNNYHNVHDCLISLPIAEDLEFNEIHYVVDSLRKIRDESK